MKLIIIKKKKSGIKIRLKPKIEDTNKRKHYIFHIGNSSKNKSGCIPIGKKFDSIFETIKVQIFGKHSEFRFHFFIQYKPCKSKDNSVQAKRTAFKATNKLIYNLAMEEYYRTVKIIRVGLYGGFYPRAKYMKFNNTSFTF